VRLLPLDKCQPGVILGKSIYHENGKALLTKGTKLTDQLIASLKRFHIYTIYIEDEQSEGIEIIESVPEPILIEAMEVITNGLNNIVELNTNHSNFQGMMKSGRVIRSFQKIFRDILGALKDNPTALNLLATTKIHDNHVYTHSLNVAIYACQLAIENGLPLKSIEDIGLGAMLHDIGKMYIQPEILNKPGKLTEDEFELMKTHCQIGFDMLRKVYEIPLTVAHCAFQHHERIDGTGYPRGLKGEEIHKYAKILSVADVFDAVTSHRVYRPALLPHRGLELLYAGVDTQLDRQQVSLFKKCIAIYPQGMTVKLNDGRTGIVTNYNFLSVERPQIRVIKDEEGQDIKPYEMDLASTENIPIEIIDADPLLYY